MNFRFNIKLYLLFMGLLLVNVFKGQKQTKIESITSVTYAVVSIPFSPCSFTTGTQILANQDDVWSTALNVGFNFSYFGKAYNSFIVGVNGQISFSTSLATGYDAWSIFNAIPNIIDMPRNTICASFRDIDPSFAGAIYYGTIGTAPNRHLIVSWDSIPLFDNPGPCSGNPNSTFQLVLHETTNCIDIFVKNSTTCSGWNGGYGILGIQDSLGTTGYSAPGRNYPSTWTAINEGWRFIPSGSTCGISTPPSCAISTIINNIQTNQQVKIYPNPSDGFFKINSSFNEGYLEIRSVIGEEIHQQKIISQETQVDIRNLNKGVYYLKIISKDSKTIYQTKIVRQ